MIQIEKNIIERLLIDDLRLSASVCGKSIIFTMGFLCCFTCLCYGQEIKGKVIDKITKEPIIGANIASLDASIGTVTDKNGIFSIEVNENEFIVSFVGYQQRKIQTSSAFITIELERDNVLLEGVTLTTKSIARTLQETSMPVTVIDIKDIQGTVSNVQEIISKTAGITIRSTGGVGSVSKISLRGLEGNRIGYFINNKSMSDNTDFLDINDIPIDLIERIEIYKGIVPGRLGGNAMGGAVNIITKGYPDKTYDLSYSIGSYNTHRLGAIAKFNNVDKTYEYGFGGFYTYADNDYEMELPLQKGRKVMRLHDGFQKLLFGGGFSSKKWYFDEIEVKPLWVKSKKEIQGVENRISEAYSYINMFALSLSSLRKQNFLLDGLDLNASAIYNFSTFGLVDKASRRQNWDGSYYPATTALGGEIGTNPNDAKNTKHSVISRLNLDYAINETNFINLNTTFNYAFGEPKDELKDQALGYQTNYNTLLHSATLNLTYTHRDSEDIWLNATTLKGYHYDVTSKVLPPNSISTEPTTVDLNKNDFGVNHSVRFRATPHMMMKASAAYDIRLPSEEELIGDGFTIVPSGNLLPERNLGFNLGAYFDKRITEERTLQIEANIFYSYLENMIRFTGNFLNAKYENFGKMRTYGIDLDIKYDVTPYAYLFINATLQDLRDAQKLNPGSTVNSATYNLRMPNIPYFYANGGCELHKENLFGGKQQNSKFFISSSFIHEYFYDFEVSRFQERKIPSTLSFDLGMEHSWRNGNSSVGIQVNNITNEVLITEFRRPLPGRTVSLKLRHIIH